jgi:CheY-like chemotaxis protein/two-component sensor histidine kinase
MAAIGQLAGGIAHDFNNILQAIGSLATVLRLRAASAELAKIVAEIEALIKRGSGLTQQLLLFSRREVSQRQRENLGEVVGPAISMLRHLIPENIKISVDLASEPLWFDGDGSQIHQVVINLALNAKDSMRSGGAIFLRTGREDGEIWLEVEDQGCGMSPEEQARIFEPFFTTKKAGHGTGLGLSVVHGIVERHGGRIEVASQPGKGSRFRVFLPESLPSQGVVAAAEPGDETELTAGRGRRVLIVEDEEGARNGLVEALEMLGFDVTAAASGEEAQALAAEPGFDLLLTDLMLPGMDGSTLASVLCERWPNLKVIMMSGYTEDEAVRRGVDEGRVRFLQKPFDIARLGKELEVALAD